MTTFKRKGEIRMKKKFLFCCLFLLTFLTILTVDKTAKAVTGSGTEDDPYLISTASDLRAVGADLTGHYKQMNDIDLKHEEFTMIAANDNPGFQGTYDGCGHKIKNLKVCPTSPYGGIGLFARCNNATIIGLEIVNPEIENGSTGSGPSVGGVIGTAKDTIIENCSVTGEGYIKNNYASGGDCRIAYQWKDY